MADPIQSFLDGYGQPETEHIPQSRPICCCGNETCAYLKHNQSALDGLEKDVSTAARLGKALLMRHEAYIADSERERKAMSAHIEMLEADKQALEKMNATVIEENRNLLDQLEAVNSAVAESDAHVTSLQATLQSTQQELQKLAQLATSTEWLERQLSDFEREQALWQSSLDAKEESEKSAIRRWQKAERTLANLQDEIERIEREAKEEKERHGEVMERMERRHAVEKELGSAAGRLKGAAAVKNGTNGDIGGPNVVSHFVKDILQDNANLQMGIVELRDLLNNSNEEVESLRNQLQMHQPTDEEARRNQTPIQRKDLKAELSRANSQELHVHHHYHAPVAAPKTQAPRRPKKKRLGAFIPGHYTPSSGASTPRSFFSYGSPTSTATILQQTAASVPQSIPARDRWSTQSSSTYHSRIASSGPSSPQSATNRTSSIFDRVFSDAGLESSRPTTPDTEDPGSPVFGPAWAKRSRKGSFRTNSAPVVSRSSIGSGLAMPTLDAILSVEEPPKLDGRAISADAIPEEDDNEWENESSPPVEETSSMTSPMSDDVQGPFNDCLFYKPPLRRAASHESVLSVAGADIHTLKSRPSQFLAPYGGRGITSQAVISGATAHATRPTAMSRPSDNSRSLLSGMAADQRQAAAKPAPVGKKVGGWFFGRWGATPTPATTEAPRVSASTPAKTIKTTTLPSTGVGGAAKKSASVPSVDAKAAQSSSDNTSTKPAKPATVPSGGDKAEAPSARSTNVLPAGDRPLVKSTKSASVSAISDKAVTDPQATPKKPKLRPPGINQSGPLFGFFPEVKTPTPTQAPVMEKLDTEALRELLNG